MNRLLDFARLEATGANLHPFDLTVRQFDPHALDVGIPPASGVFVGVAYFMPCPRTATTNLTDLGHLYAS